jgi:aminoglycoside phosphotransferase family enzyme/predicted kinase
MDQRHLDALRNPANYPEPTATVEFLQTHVSWLFLTERFVYKVKKPVDFGFLNFSTIDRRRFYCTEEVRLNRRLCPDVYLGVVEVRETPDGAAFTGDGPVLDYAVKMRRLPAERMLDRLLAQGEVGEDEMRLVARTIAAFHQAAERGPEIAAYGSLDVIRQNWQENFQQIEPFVGTCLTDRDRNRLREWVEQAVASRAELFARRAATGYIRDCDGDLHLENICLADQVYIFDCIEFNSRFRYSDTASDLAFLLMDLELHGRGDLAAVLQQEYLAHTGDREAPLLLDFYKVYRAVVRGKVNAFRLVDHRIPPAEQEAARTQASRYFRLSRGYLLKERLSPTLFITCGMVGSGKSTVAAQLGIDLALPVFNSDLVRKRLAGVRPTSRQPDPPGSGLYDEESTTRTYSALRELAGRELAAGRSVIVDATFRRRKDRREFSAMAARHGAGCVILLTLCPEELILARLAARQAGPATISDGRAELLPLHRQEFDAPTAAEGRLLTIDTSAPPFAIGDHILQRLELP